MLASLHILCLLHRSLTMTASINVYCCLSTWAQLLYGANTVTPSSPRCQRGHRERLENDLKWTWSSWPTVKQTHTCTDPLLCNLVHTHTHTSIVFHPQHSHTDSPPTRCLATDVVSVHSVTAHWKTWQCCSWSISGLSVLGTALTWGDLL